MSTDKSLLEAQSQPSFLGVVIGRFICSFKGHFPEKYLNETDGWICTTRCKRCHSTLMGGLLGSLNKYHHQIQMNNR